MNAGSYDDDDDARVLGKPHCVERPTVTGPMTEKTGLAILSKLDEIKEDLMALLINAMDAAHQAKIDRMVDGGGEEGAEDHDAEC